MRIVVLRCQTGTAFVKNRSYNGTISFYKSVIIFAVDDPSDKSSHFGCFRNNTINMKFPSEIMGKVPDYLW